MRQTKAASTLRFLLAASIFPVAASAQPLQITNTCGASDHRLLLAGNGRALPIYVAPGEPELLNLAAAAFAGDVERVTGLRPQVIHSLDGVREGILLGTLGKSLAIDALAGSGRIDASAIRGKWESAVTVGLDHPSAALQRALVIAGSDRRGAAFALFTLSREMGVSPWAWWADVPTRHQDAVCVDFGVSVQGEPSVPYRGIFLNDEDWGLRPWAAKKMDPELHNIGPHTYRQVFELLLRLQANTLWPAMHPGTLPFNAIPENARLADQWGIVVGSSHSEAMLRNNVGEWDEKRNGPWDYQTNREAINAYWNKRLLENGKYENFYTMGMRGVHDSGMEAAGTVTDKAHLIDEVLASQRALLAADVNPNVQQVPQAIWLYKEVLELYRAGMKIPDDVTLGWTDDNYGYIRQLPNAEEQKRAGGSAIYYHVSYWGFPHDYLWLCTTPPALIREEMTKAWDHGARRLWILNVGDLKPAESDIDYFMQLAWDEPATSKIGQTEFLERWYTEQFGPELAPQIASIMDEFYNLNFIRKPEFMGFNGYDDQVRRTDFNPLAWGDQNQERMEKWEELSQRTEALKTSMPSAFEAAFLELVAYPVEAAAAQNEKFLWADRSFLDGDRHEFARTLQDHNNAHAAFARVQALTREYNQLEGGKWDGMMDYAPRSREVFNMPVTAIDSYGEQPLPASWAAPAQKTLATCAEEMNSAAEFHEENATVSINASHFARKRDGANAQWRLLDDMGISGSSLVLDAPGRMESIADVSHLDDAPWVEYEFTTVSQQNATLTVDLLPVFPVDSAHRLRFAVALDNAAPHTLDLSGAGEWKEGSAPTWEANVLRNFAELQMKLGTLSPGKHTLRLIYIDPAVVFEHLTITFPGAAPAYPVPPETRCAL